MMKEGYRVMFICEDCNKKKTEPLDDYWFIFGPLSKGCCEICGKAKTCVDAPRYTRVNTLTA